MHFVTAHDASIPALGFGTFRLTGSQAGRMVSCALETGYRHIDTAQMYGNEAEVGAAIAQSGLPRDAVFVTTKVWPDRFRGGDLQRSVAESLGRLKLDRVDLLLLHWPNPAVPLEETLGALNAVWRDGQARHIGISNFTTALIRRAVALSEAPLVANQVEYHPFLDQRPILAALRRETMALVAYAPIAQARVVGQPVLRRIAEGYGKTEPQVALRWLLQQEGVAAIPSTSSEQRARANFAVFDFALTADEMAAIDGLARPDGRLVSPAGLAPDWD